GMIAVTPPPEGGPGMAPPPSTQAPVKLGIALKRLDDWWVPKNPDHTKVVAQILKLQGQEWVASDIPRKITFRFVKRSSEPGDCMNHQSGMQDTPDLYFRAALNPELDCIDNSSEHNLPFYCDTAITKKEVTVQDLRIDCEDFGAY